MLHRGFRAAKKAGVDVDEEQVIHHLVFSCLSHRDSSFTTSLKILAN